MPRLRHLDALGTTRFVTFTCYRRHQYLTTDLARQVLIQGLVHLRMQRDVRILGWVLMPEHVHFVLLPPEGLRLGEAMGRFKNWTARQILSASEFKGVVLYRNDGRRALWQRRSYDHNCRTPEVVRQKIEYCHKNPVRRGLADCPSEWPWSSYNWYRHEGLILLDIDGIES
jgi:putative transposase